MLPLAAVRHGLEQRKAASREHHRFLRGEELRRPLCGQTAVLGRAREIARRFEEGRQLRRDLLMPGTMESEQRLGDGRAERHLPRRAKLRIQRVLI